MGDRLGADLLARIRVAEFPLFLRSGKCFHRRGSLARKPADIFVAGMFAVVVPESIHGRFGVRSREWTSPDRRNGIHVRSARCSVDSDAELVSRADTAIAAVGNLAVGLRPARVEVSNTDRVDCSSD